MNESTDVQQLLERAAGPQRGVPTDRVRAQVSRQRRRRRAAALGSAAAAIAIVAGGVLVAADPAEEVQTAGTVPSSLTETTAAGSIDSRPAYDSVSVTVDVLHLGESVPASVSLWVWSEPRYPDVETEARWELLWTQLAPVASERVDARVPQLNESRMTVDVPVAVSQLLVTADDEAILAVTPQEGPIDPCASPCPGEPAFLPPGLGGPEDSYEAIIDHNHMPDGLEKDLQIASELIHLSYRQVRPEPDTLWGISMTDEGLTIHVEPGTDVDAFRAEYITGSPYDEVSKMAERINIIVEPMPEITRYLR